MIQPLRTVHRRAFVALAVLLPAILTLGLAARRPGGNSGQSADIPATARLVKESAGLWQKHPIQTEFYRDPENPQTVYFVFKAQQLFNEPDLLLYWTSKREPTQGLAADARLLGVFRQRRVYALRSDAVLSGHLVLYSLAHQEVIDTAAVEKLP